VAGGVREGGGRFGGRLPGGLTSPPWRVLWDGVPEPPKHGLRPGLLAPLRARPRTAIKPTHRSGSNPPTVPAHHCRDARNKTARKSRVVRGNPPHAKDGSAPQTWGSANFS